MNELNIPRMPSISAFRKRCATIFKMARGAAHLAVVAFLVTVMVGCVNPPERSQAGSRDHLLGWFKLPGRDEKNQVVSGHDTLIPLFKRDGAYYSVCRGIEAPLKECAEGLEWADAPSSMIGTKIGWDEASRTHYLAVMDSLASNFTDGRYGCGEKERMTRIEKPSGLLDARARRPRTRDDFLGWYQPVWFPWVKIEIRKDSDQYVSQEHEFRGPQPGSWETRAETRKLTPLSDQLGFTGFEQQAGPRLVYNEALNRFELVKALKEATRSIIRMPLVRVLAPSSPGDDAAPSPMTRIGIPAWH